MTLLIYLASMTDFDRDYDQLFVADFCDDPEVSDAIPPILAKVSCERLSEDARIFTIDQIIFQPADHTVTRAFIQLLQRPIELLSRCQSIHLLIPSRLR